MTKHSAFALPSLSEMYPSSLFFEIENPQQAFRKIRNAYLLSVAGFGLALGFLAWMIMMQSEDRIENSIFAVVFLATLCLSLRSLKELQTAGTCTARSLSDWMIVSIVAYFSTGVFNLLVLLKRYFWQSAIDVRFGSEIASILLNFAVAFIAIYFTKRFIARCRNVIDDVK